jgi:O-acetyl-ADP-ribose deacetylase
MTSARLGALTLELTTGDIAAQDDLDAVVNAANAELTTGGGVAGAIHRAAGPGLARECRPLAPIQPGEAVITGGHGLPNAHVVHVLGPVYGRDEPGAGLLASCYRQALDRAEEAGVTSIGFPAISTGVFGYPMSEAAEIAVGTIRDEAPRRRSVRRVRFVLFDRAALEAHERALTSG